jgi:hypothetical protein
MIALSGEIAQARFVGGEGRQTELAEKVDWFDDEIPPGHDWYSARTMATWIWGKAVVESDTAGKYLLWLEARTRDLFSSDPLLWPAVERIAKDLLVRKTITGHRARSLFEESRREVFARLAAEQAAEEAGE